MAQLDELTAAINTYFAAIHECDVEKLDAVFHSQSSLFDADNGEVFVEPIASFRADVAGRTSPHSAGQDLVAEILMIDFLSPISATVKSAFVLIKTSSWIILVSQREVLAGRSSQRLGTSSTSCRDP